MPAAPALAGALGTDGSPVLDQSQPLEGIEIAGGGAAVGEAAGSGDVAQAMVAGSDGAQQRGVEPGLAELFAQQQVRLVIEEAVAMENRASEVAQEIVAIRELKQVAGRRARCLLLAKAANSGALPTRRRPVTSANSACADRYRVSKDSSSRSRSTNTILLQIGYLKTVVHD